MNKPGPGLVRRSFLRLSALGLVAAAGAPLSGCGLLARRAPIDTTGQVDFHNRLWIPPLAKSTVRDRTRTFDLTAQSGTTAIVTEGDTETWGLNGSMLGPTLRARRGETVRIDVTNSLNEATTLHWHGMHLPSVADGGPHQMIEPDATWSPTWTIDQPAATLWYHPHPHGRTGRHVYRGLGGLFIVDDDEEGTLDLPRRYGVDDIPVIVQDKAFDDQGQFVETSRRDNGMLGDTILVNGTAGAVLDITAQRTRLRLLNASTARSYAFGFSDDREFAMVASDGGLLRAPARLTRITLTPGERAEIIVTMSPGENTTLRSYPQDLGLAESRSRSTGAADTLDVLFLKSAAHLDRSAPIPDHLTMIESLEAPSAVKTRKFELGDKRINGESMDMSRIDEVVTVDTTEIWIVRNTHSQPHNFHVHDVQFQILSIDDGAPPTELSGWKDTVYVPPQTEVELIMRFADHADPAMPYMYHCHLLWHEDEGMMGQFVVVAPGQQLIR